MTRTEWHRIFGLLLTDYFAGSPFVVELEKDLSLKQQFLDVVILRKGKGQWTERLPDGLENLAEHNLLTFKSQHEALDDWALKELTGHYVNYRKQLADRGEPLLPEGAFRLYAVCSRFPHNLVQQVACENVKQGVYDCRRGTDRVRVVVAGQLSLSEHNAFLHVFSASAERFQYGKEHCRLRSPDTSSLIYELFEGYRAEGINMPYTMEDFRRDFTKKHIKDLTPEERLEGLTPEELLKGLSPEQVEQLRERLNAERSTGPNKKPRRKKP